MVRRVVHRMEEPVFYQSPIESNLFQHSMALKKFKTLIKKFKILN